MRIHVDEKELPRAAWLRVSAVCFPLVVEVELCAPSRALGGGVRRRWRWRRILGPILSLLLIVFIEEERKHSQDAADSHSDGFSLQTGHTEGQYEVTLISHFKTLLDKALVFLIVSLSNEAGISLSDCQLISFMFG